MWKSWSFVWGTQRDARVSSDENVAESCCSVLQFGRVLVLSRRNCSSLQTP